MVVWQHLLVLLQNSLRKLLPDFQQHQVQKQLAAQRLLWKLEHLRRGELCPDAVRMRVLQRVGVQVIERLVEKTLEKRALLQRHILQEHQQKVGIVGVLLSHEQLHRRVEDLLQDASREVLFEVDVLLQIQLASLDDEGKQQQQVQVMILLIDDALRDDEKHGLDEKHNLLKLDEVVLQDALDQEHYERLRALLEVGGLDECKDLLDVKNLLVIESAEADTVLIVGGWGRRVLQVCVLVSKAV